MNGLVLALVLVGCVLFAYAWGVTMGYAWGRGQTALDRRIARQLNQWARVDACYECGELVTPDEGEQHGRSGWVHYHCMADDVTKGFDTETEIRGARPRGAGDGQEFA